jgi:hypothetical protein
MITALIREVEDASGKEMKIEGTWLPGQTKCSVVLERPETLKFQGK